MKSKCHILFLFCPYAGHSGPHRFDINHGSAYLAAYLEQQGLLTKIFYG